MSKSSATDRFSMLTIGQSAERSRTVTEEDIRHFADATGDRNPVHFDELAGKHSIFGSRVAHGMLSAGFISAAIATDLPGPGTVYLSQSLRFLHPVRVGDVIVARVEITAINVARRRVTLATTCVNQEGEAVVDGEAVVMVPQED